MHETNHYERGICQAAFVLAACWMLSEPASSIAQDSVRIVSSRRNQASLETRSEPQTEPDLPLPELLQGIEGVADVRILVDTPQPQTTIIHLRDWHFVGFETFALSTGADVPADQQPAAYRRFLSGVQRVQDQQAAVLTALAKRGAKQVWLEGLTSESFPRFHRTCRTAMQRDAIPEDDAELIRLVPQPLWIGAAGRLLLDRTVVVQPAETEYAYAIGSNSDAAGQPVEVTAAALEYREDVIVWRMMSQAGPQILVLGGGHDLTNNVHRLGAGRVRLLAVSVAEYLQAAGE